jgi:hypothetical protein
MNIYHEPHELAVRKPFLTFKFHEIRRIMKVFQQISEDGSCGSWLFSSKPYIHAFVVGGNPIKAPPRVVASKVLKQMANMPSAKE